MATSESRKEYLREYHKKHKSQHREYYKNYYQKKKKTRNQETRNSKNKNYVLVDPATLDMVKTITIQDVMDKEGVSYPTAVRRLNEITYEGLFVAEE